VITIRNRSRT